MSRETQAWMPIYIGDYLGDTARFTTEQHGAYFLLMLDYWRNGPAPDDDAVLQQITKLDKAGWRRCRSALAAKFKIVNGEWRHKRIDEELERAAANADRRSSKAKAAAAARWSNDAPSNARSMPQAKLGECPPPSPSPDKNNLASFPSSARDVSACNDPSDFEYRCRSVAQEIDLIRPIGPADRDIMRAWIRDGLHFENHILEGVKRVAAREKGRGHTIRSFKYLDQGVREYHDEWLRDLERYRAGAA